MEIDMLIAITADLHLGDYQEYPERENALREILKILVDQNIKILIIAGDCFDQNNPNILALEKIIKESKMDQIVIYLLRGNHDESIRQSFFSMENIRVIETTKIETIAEKKFLFVPYKSNYSMGAEISMFEIELNGESWVLIGHGNLSSSISEGAQYETGFYMPLSKRDINLFKPTLCFLGHIHSPFEEKNIYSPGSPCGLDITESGRRRILFLETQTMQVRSQSINTDVLYLNESILVYPSENEIKQISEEIDLIFQPYSSIEISKIKIRLSLFGYSFDRSQLKKRTESYIFDKYDIKELEIFIDEVFPANEDFVRQQISKESIVHINELDLQLDDDQKKQVIKEAMKLIFGGKS
jgi:DNA repair exonuclease SbcCD nuclease subunit